MTDLNQYLMNKDHDFVGGAMIAGTPMIGKPHLIGMNSPPIATIGSITTMSTDDKNANKFAKIKPSISRERVGLNANQLLINLQNYNFKQSSLMMNAVVAPQSVHHKRQFSDLN